MSSPLAHDTKSILVSTPKGLKRLDVPFLVMVLVNVNNLQVGDKVVVILVTCTYRDNLLYYIQGNYYKYYLFVIIDKRMDK